MTTCGPHTLEEIHQTYADSELHRFPNAQIIPTNLTEIANAVEPHRASLPVLTNEIGDTWIHGVASDPLKLATLSRSRAAAARLVG